jgi:hypothetical protein
MSDTAAAEPAPEDTATPARDRPRPRRWELIIALALAVTSVSGAVLTYLSVQQESAAADADEQAVTETILVQQRQAGASTQTFANGDLAARYRRLLADAEALEATDPERAAVTRQLAAAIANQTGILEFVSGPGASGRFDHQANLEAALHYSDVLAIPPDQPDRTAARADAYRDRSQALALGAVGMLGVVVLLTLARVGRRRWPRVGLFAAATAGYLGVVVVTAVRAI